MFSEGTRTLFYQITNLYQYKLCVLHLKIMNPFSCHVKICVSALLLESGEKRDVFIKKKTKNIVISTSV